MFTFPDRCQLLNRNGKTIFQMTFSNLAVEDSLKMVHECQQFVCSQEHKSLMTITDISGATYSKETTEALKNFAKENKPYVIAGAVIGVTGMKKIIFDAIMAFSGRRNLKIHDSVDAALVWLENYSE